MSQIGSGALPVETLPSAALVLTPHGRGTGGKKGAGGRCRRLAEALRALPVPIIGRLSDDAVVLDLRTLEDETGFLNSLGALRV
jgi:L-seryl-tRNA(Ser) seleniumtransferase